MEPEPPEDDPWNDPRYRWQRRIAVVVSVAGCLVVLVVAMRHVSLDAVRREFTSAPAAPQTFPVRYTGEFRYVDGARPVWCAEETLRLPGDVYDRLRDVRRRLLEGLSSQPPPPGPRCARPAAEERASGARPPGSGRPGWRYGGTVGTTLPRHVFTRVAEVPVDRRPQEDERVIETVPVPYIAVGPVTLIPDADSTVRFEGPRRLLRGTSPQAPGEPFADEVSFTVDVGDLAGTARQPRIEIGEPEPRGDSTGTRIALWTARALLALIGLAITTAVTLGVQHLFKQVLERRRPQPRRPHRRRLRGRGR